MISVFAAAVILKTAFSPEHTALSDGVIIGVVILADGATENILEIGVPVAVASQLL